MHMKSSPEYVIATFRVRVLNVTDWQKQKSHYQHGKIPGGNIDTKEKNSENLNKDSYIYIEF